MEKRKIIIAKVEARLIKTLEEKGYCDYEIAIASIMRDYGVSRRTAKEYIEPLVALWGLMVKNGQIFQKRSEETRSLDRFINGLKGNNLL